jgi:CelD/BcsL family acetyltransferase involved in cellulose biosynthesis
VANFFLDPRLLACFQEAVFPDQTVGSGLFAVEERVFRLPVLATGRVLSDLPFFDYFEPEDVAVADAAAASPYPYLRSAVTGVYPAARWTEPELSAGALPAPFIDWSRFSTWEAFESHIKTQRSALLRDTRRRLNKLEREVGEVELRENDRSAQALDLLIRWKSDQCRRTGIGDMFASAAYRRFFHLMHQRGVVRLDTLCSGDRVLAAAVGFDDEGRYGNWITGYDPALAECSPGRVMLSELLRRSYDRRDLSFEFLIGDEAYKWHYATHFRRVGEVGEPPALLRLRRRLRDALAQVPGGLALAQGMRKGVHSALETVERLRTR